LNTDNVKPSEHNRSDFNRVHTPSELKRHTPSIAEVNKYTSGPITNEQQQ